MIISAVTDCHSNARSRRITGVKPKSFNMSGGPYGGKSSLATVRVHRLARAPPRTGKYLDIATDRSVPRSLASSVHARRRGRGRTRLRSGDGHLHRPGTSRARLSSPLGGGTRIVTLARESITGRSPRRTTRRFEGFSVRALVAKSSADGRTNVPLTSPSLPAFPSRSSKSKRGRDPPPRRHEPCRR